MSRDYWMTRRKAPIIDKLKQTLTIQAGTWNCGPSLGSLYITKDFSAAPTITERIPMPSGDIVIDFYAKILPGSTGKLIRVFDPAALTGFELEITASAVLRVKTTSGSGVDIYALYCNYLSAWHRYTLSYDDSNHTGFFCLDGEIIQVLDEQNSGFIIMPTDADIILGNSATATEINGYFSEVRIWNKYMTYDEVLNTASYRGVFDAANDLVYYARLRNLTNVPIVGNGNFYTNSTTAIASTTEYPIIKYGGSFVVAEWPVTLTKNISLQWPAVPPANTTGALCVRWIDTAGQSQRRALWNLDGVDIAPIPAMYAGENLGNSFVLEFWNIDGNATASLPTNYVLGISSCTNPTTSYDKTQQAAVSVTPVSTLAEGFPLTPFPLQFNEQQTY